MAAGITEAAWGLLRRQTTEGDPEDPPKEMEKELSSSLALFILIILLIVALFTSYILQTRKIQAVHETVLSIYAGMTVGFILRVLPDTNTGILKVVIFDYQFFFNLLLPPIILASGYELHQANFFKHIGPILTFAFLGTFISTVVLGILMWLMTSLPIYGFDVTFVEAFSVGATLSATDPVTILAIFNAYKVDPKLYTIIFGESILNDAIAIVLFETAQKYLNIPEPGGKEPASLTIVSLFEALGIFLLVFCGSCLIGIAVGIGTTLGLKFTHVRRFPKTESCLIVLIAYASYFFSTAIHASGIVTLLFCGITLKHYAYYNMSRRTQLTTKFVFQVMAQLSENFIFIYLGLTLFADRDLRFRPLLIIVTMIGVCVARYAAVFPLSKLVNWTTRVRNQKRGETVAEEIPNSYQVMLFWAGLRGAVGVALAFGMKSGVEKMNVLKATVLVVVVLTVIIFGGTTSRMLEIMGIETGVVGEVDSDDEFDIETAANGTYYKRGGTAFGHTPTRSDFPLSLDSLNGTASYPHSPWDGNGYSSGSNKSNGSHRPGQKRKNSNQSQREHEEAARKLLATQSSSSQIAEDNDCSDSDLPPAAPRRSPNRRPSPPPTEPSQTSTYPTSGTANNNLTSADPHNSHLTARGVIKDFFTTTDESAEWFKKLDDNLIKPTLLLDQNSKGGSSSGNNNAGASKGGGHGGSNGKD